MLISWSSTKLGPFFLQANGCLGLATLLGGALELENPHGIHGAVDHLHLAEVKLDHESPNRDIMISIKNVKKKTPPRTMLCWQNLIFALHPFFYPLIGSVFICMLKYRWIPTASPVTSNMQCFCAPLHWCGSSRCTSKSMAPQSTRCKPSSWREWLVTQQQQQ